MNIGLPQIVMIVLLAMGWTVSAIKHGQQKNETYHIGTASVATLIYVILLWWGGFFS